jgi:hypothetical protein
MEVAMQYLNGYNRQKVMEQIKKNNQGYQAYSGGSCFYRTHEEDYNCCLVGCFIPDDRYDECMEDRDAEDVINSFNLHDVMPMDIKSMIGLQTFHDEILDDVSGEEFFFKIYKYIVDMEKRLV